MNLDRKRDALLIIDLQPDFMPGGALAVAGGDELVTPIANLARSGLFSTIVATQDWHPRGHVSFASTQDKQPFETLLVYGQPQTLWPDHCVQGTPGASLHAALPDEPLSLILRKGTNLEVDSYSAFRENLGPDGRRQVTGLGAWLTSRGITRVFACGLARDYCVRWTVQDAAAEGFASFIIDDLTRAVDPSGEPALRSAFEAAGVRRVFAGELS